MESGSQLRPEPLIEEIVQDCFLVHTHLPLERAVPGAVTFQLPAGGDATGTTSYRLEYTYAGADRGFGLHLFVLKSENFAEGKRPCTVNAFKDGDKREMQPGQKNSWGPVYWTDLSSGLDGTGGISIRLALDFGRRLSEGQRVLLRHVSNLFDHPTMTDVQFLVRGEAICAHAAIVAAGSPVLAATFRDQYEQHRRRPGLGGLTVVQVDAQVDPVVFRRLLAHLYTGNCEDLADGEPGLEALFVLATKYEVQWLRSTCERGLVRALRLDNAVHHLMLAHRFAAGHLMKATLQLIRSNKAAIFERPEWKQLIHAEPELFYQAVQLMF